MEKVAAYSETGQGRVGALCCTKLGISDEYCEARPLVHKD